MKVSLNEDQILDSYAANAVGINTSFLIKLSARRTEARRLLSHAAPRSGGTKGGRGLRGRGRTGSRAAGPPEPSREGGAQAARRVWER